MSDLPAIGITMFVTDRSMSPIELAREVEARNFASLFLPEHSHIPVSRETVWPGSRPGENDPLPDYYSHMLDQIVSLSMIGAVTTNLELGTAVTLIPQHDPIWLAKQFATLDHLTGGRVIIGAGFGWNREQGEDHGSPYLERRDQTEDCIAIMRSLWRDEVAAHKGQHASVSPSWAWPKPARSGGPPIVIGGMGPRTYRAIARYADGWMPISGRSSLADRLEPIKREFEAVGRDPSSLEVVVAGATTDPDGLINLGREGVQRALLTVWSEDRDETLRLLDQYAEVKRRAEGLPG
ncbi:MAG: TIGR03619 family F420-dependent LLM class oxidoreductase [Gammaproteobacteria bacterium]|nr:TIGR03619 family F420-dependent LLM class oxidoreductase [Gammaproteobacteria bacterium]MBT4493475.1 TIGR03619 family F420-dependent LLM class oxidoreductase [Gammaproteobacteria bacterium]MBT7372283.1 TIGR03619 family F420-dependent LLM class oxidoreductase [Gammaproteobacteria bacterium]